MSQLPPIQDPPAKPFRQQIPVWAPDPAVPLFARILSYLFATFMLLTVIRACAMPRPFDYPNLPTMWKNSDVNGVSLPYPDDWHKVRIADSASWVLTDLQFYYTPPTRNVLQLRMITTNDADINPQKVIANLIDNYVEQSDADDSAADWHTFVGYPVGTTRKISGAWVIRVVGDQTVILLAYSPEQGWQVTRQILAYMCDHIVSTQSTDVPL
jgi:hypothetical protein